MKVPIYFVNKIVKQGNSLCVRVPKSIIKEGNLKEGMSILMSIQPQEINYEYNAEEVDHVFKIAKKVKKLDKYDDTKKRFFIMLNFDFLDKIVSKDQKQEKKNQIKFIKEKKKEYGTKLINEFIEFEQTFNKEAFITEEDGTCILKPEYRLMS